MTLYHQWLWVQDVAVHFIGILVQVERTLYFRGSIYTHRELLKVLKVGVRTMMLWVLLSSNVQVWETPQNAQEYCMQLYQLVWGLIWGCLSSFVQNFADKSWVVMATGWSCTQVSCIRNYNPELLKALAIQLNEFQVHSGRHRKEYLQRGVLEALMVK